VSDPFLGKTVGRYVIESELGRGGMGVVYRGRQVSLGRPVAIKLLPASLGNDTEAVERLRQEARVIAGLAHENIVYVYDVGQLDRSTYVIMELVDGQSLKEYARGRALPVAEVRAIGRALAGALSHAHERGIVHRDVKSANVMRTKGGQIKLMDFGIARVPESSLKTRTGSLLGTPHYMAPDYIQTGTVSPKTDLYSLGVLLYELSTGRLPFTGDESMAVVRKHVVETPVAPRSIVPSLPASLEAVILKAMEKDPAKRWSSGAELEQALADLEEERSAGPAAAVPAAAVPAGVPVALPASARTQPMVPPGAPPTAAMARPTVVEQPAPKRPFPVLPLAAAALLVAGGVTLLAMSRRNVAPIPVATGLDATGVAGATGGAPVSPSRPKAPAPEPTAIVPTILESPAKSVPAPQPAGEPTQPAGQPAQPDVQPAPDSPPSGSVPAATNRGSRRRDRHQPTPLPGSEALEAAPEVRRADHSVTVRKGVKIDVDPDQSRVFLDGRYIGISDDWDGHGGGALLLFERDGRHQLRFAYPGYKDLVVDVTVSHDAREKTEEIDYKLEEGKPTGPTGPQGKMDRPSYTTVGPLRFDVNPSDATVTVDGRSIGPASRFRKEDYVISSLGVHDIVLSAPGRRSKSLRVVVAPDTHDRAEIDESLREN